LISEPRLQRAPTPAGGIYAFEQQRMLVPPVDNPLAQPYAAFRPTADDPRGEPRRETLVGSLAAISKAGENAEVAARREVEEAIADTAPAKRTTVPASCSTQPHCHHHGADDNPLGPPASSTSAGIANGTRFR
jgi:hypothetical protein